MAALEIVDVPVRVHEPGAAPDAQTMTRTTEPPMMTKGRAILVALTHRYLSGLLDPFVILIEVRKLMYFMQDAGEPLQLNYKKHYDGPYADNLRHVLNVIEGYFIVGYADGGDDPCKHIDLVPGAVRDGNEQLLQHRDT